MSALNGKHDFALVPRPPAQLEKAEPGRKRVLSGMVADTLVLAKKPKPLTIVIIDDEPLFLDLYGTFLPEIFKDVTVLLFADGETAWQTILRTTPDVLITDMNRGGLDGWKMLASLAAKKVQFPIFVVSGTAEESEVLKCAGPELTVSFLPKPFDVRLFAKKLESVLKISCDAAKLDEMTSAKTHPIIKIIMVNDDEGPLASFEIIIQRYFKNARMMLFQDSAGAIQELSKSDPDLLITDKMPGISGWEICQHLLDRQVKYPVIVHSSWGDEAEHMTRDFAERGLNTSFLSIPCDIESIVNAVENALQITRDPG
jgi:DNA-binding NtrC family response regulator